MQPSTYNPTYSKYNISPFMKVRYGKDVGEVVASQQLENDKVVVKFDHFRKDDFVNVTKLIFAGDLIPAGESGGEEKVHQKKFSSEHEDDRNPRNKRHAASLEAHTEIIKQARRPR